MRVLVAGEGVQVGVEDLRQLDEQRRRERPPVGLDQVEVAGGDPEPLGELDLGELLPATKRPDLGPQPGRIRRAFAHFPTPGHLQRFTSAHDFIDFS